MSSVQINPPGVDLEYLECLNTAFGNWGDARRFNWHFRRVTSFPAADLLVCREGEKLAAGSAITYRRLRLPNDEEIGVGIITGSWTLPQHRGKGLFSRIIERSIEQAETKGAKLILAFVTADNVSCRLMQGFGSVLIPTFYVFSTESTPHPKANSRFELIEPRERLVAEMFEKFSSSGKGLARFVYPSAPDFRAQFFDRPNQTQFLSSGNGDFAVVEKGESTNLLQLFLSQGESNCFADLLTDALRQNRKFFAFTMDEEAAVIGKDLGLEIKAGFLTVLPIGANKFLPGGPGWRIQNGDRT